MERTVTILFINLHTYHIADLCKFTFYYLLFEIDPFAKCAYLMNLDGNFKVKYTSNNFQ